MAIVNQTFVKRYLDGRDPIGVQFSAGYPEPDPRNEVDGRRRRRTTSGRRRVSGRGASRRSTQPLDQVPLPRQTMVVATSLADVGVAAVGDSRARCASSIRRSPSSSSAVTDLVAGTLRRQQLGMTLMLIFGGVAVLLAAVGIYGVVAYAVSQRRDEMATRLALGATPGSVFWLVMSQGAMLALAGTAIGLVVAYLSGQIVASQIYAIRASDPLMLGAAIVARRRHRGAGDDDPGVARVAAGAVRCAAYRLIDFYARCRYLRDLGRRRRRSGRAIANLHARAAHEIGRLENRTDGTEQRAGIRTVHVERAVTSVDRHLVAVELPRRRGHNRALS